MKFNQPKRKSENWCCVAPRCPSWP